MQDTTVAKVLFTTVLDPSVQKTYKYLYKNKNILQTNVSLAYTHS